MLMKNDNIIPIFIHTGSVIPMDPDRVFTLMTITIFSMFMKKFPFQWTISASDRQST